MSEYVTKQAGLKCHFDANEQTYCGVYPKPV